MTVRSVSFVGPRTLAINYICFVFFGALKTWCWFWTNMAKPRRTKNLHLESQGCWEIKPNLEINAYNFACCPAATVRRHNLCFRPTAWMATWISTKTVWFVKFLRFLDDAKCKIPALGLQKPFRYGVLTRKTIHAQFLAWQWFGARSMSLSQCCVVRTEVNAFNRQFSWIPFKLVFAGLNWRSRVINNGYRWVNCYCKQLMQYPDLIRPCNGLYLEWHRGWWFFRGDIHW